MQSRKDWVLCLACCTVKLKKAGTLEIFLKSDSVKEKQANPAWKILNVYNNTYKWVIMFFSCPDLPYDWSQYSAYSANISGVWGTNICSLAWCWHSLKPLRMWIWLFWKFLFVFQKFQALIKEWPADLYGVQPIISAVQVSGKDIKTNESD